MADRRPPPDPEVDGLLCDVSDWRLPDTGWHRTAEAVEALAAALRSGDPAAVARAGAALELTGPHRANRLGEEEARESTPAPKAVRDRILEVPHRHDVGSRPHCWSTGPDGTPVGTDRCGAGGACLSARDRS